MIGGIEISSRPPRQRIARPRAEDPTSSMPCSAQSSSTCASIISTPRRRMARQGSHGTRPYLGHGRISPDPARPGPDRPHRRGRRGQRAADRRARSSRAARGERRRSSSCPSCALSGYPPEDLLFRARLPRRVPRGAGGARGASVAGIVALVGFPERAEASDKPPAEPDQRSPGARRRTTRWRCWPTARSRASTARPTCPTTASSTRAATSIPGTEAAMVDVDGALVGPHGLRGHLGPGLSRVRGGGVRRAPDRQLDRLPLRPRQGRSRASACWPSAPAPTAPSSRSATRSAARTSWSSTAAASSSPPTARWSPAPPSSSPSCWSATCCCRPRARPPAAQPACWPATPARARSPEGHTERAHRRGARTRARGLRGAGPRRPRLRREERLRGGRAGALGRHRLGAGGDGRRPTPSAPRRVNLRRHALPPLQRRDPGRRPRDRRQPGRRT